MRMLVCVLEPSESAGPWRGRPRETAARRARHRAAKPDGWGMHMPRERGRRLTQSQHRSARGARVRKPAGCDQCQTCCTGTCYGRVALSRLSVKYCGRTGGRGAWQRGPGGRAARRPRWGPQTPRQGCCPAAARRQWFGPRTGAVRSEPRARCRAAEGGKSSWYMFRGSCAINRLRTCTTCRLRRLPCEHLVSDFVQRYAQQAGEGPERGQEGGSARPRAVGLLRSAASRRKRAMIPRGRRAARPRRPATGNGRLPLALMLARRLLVTTGA